ncbi:hypothetical protein ACHAXS_009800 [Conticribra weissflogii]
MEFVQTSCRHTMDRQFPSPTQSPSLPSTFSTTPSTDSSDSMNSRQSSPSRSILPMDSRGNSRLSGHDSSAAAAPFTKVTPESPCESPLPRGPLLSPETCPEFSRKRRTDKKSRRHTPFCPSAPLSISLLSPLLSVLLLPSASATSSEFTGEWNGAWTANSNRDDDAYSRRDDDHREYSMWYETSEDDISPEKLAAILSGVVLAILALMCCACHPEIVALLFQKCCPCCGKRGDEGLGKVAGGEYHGGKQSKKEGLPPGMELV